MKKICRPFLWIICACSALLSFFSPLSAAAGSTPESPEALNILFLGNSFTFRHNLDRLVKKVFEEGHPERPVHVKRVVYGGQNMYKHASYYFSQTFIEQATITDEEINARISTMEAFLEQESSPEGWDAFHQAIRPNGKGAKFSGIHGNIQKAIQGHKQLLKNNPRIKWDYVVLQSWVDVLPSLDEGYAKYAAKLAEVAKAQGTEVILYITAPMIQNAKPVEKPLRPERVDLEIKLAKALEKKIQAHCVVPVPLGINMIQQGGTDLTFRYLKDFHPNQTCAYLTANMFYASFFKESPEGLAWNSVTETQQKVPGKDPNGNDATVVFDYETRTYLQKMAYESVMAFDGTTE